MMEICHDKDVRCPYCENQNCTYPNYLPGDCIEDNKLDFNFNNHGNNVEDE